MQVLSKDTKFAHLGKPGAVFSAGFARRLEMILEKIDLKDKKIIDVGCGEGVWLDQFSKFTDTKNIFGTDIDVESVEFAKKVLPEATFKVTAAEELPFGDGEFDFVFSNEVIEHVEDDAKVVSEMVRITRLGGYVVIFTPNRGWPFEQHGMFWKGKYIWGNIPLLPWMPKSIYNKFAPHVRNYWASDIKKLIQDQPIEVFHWSRIYPGFDGLKRKFGLLGRVIAGFFHLLEKTPLRWFGISHFIILKKTH